MPFRQAFLHPENMIWVGLAIPVTKGIVVAVPDPNYTESLHSVRQYTDGRVTEFLYPCVLNDRANMLIYRLNSRKSLVSKGSELLTDTSPFGVSIVQYNYDHQIARTTVERRVQESEATVSNHFSYTTSVDAEHVFESERY